MLVIEEEKCRKFEDGLNDYIRAYATGFGHDDFYKIVPCALNVERVNKEEYERKERRQGKKNPGQSSSYQHQNSLEDHRVLINLQLMDQLRLPVARLLYWHHQLLVHQEVHREDQLLLITHIVGGNIKDSVGG